MVRGHFRDKYCVGLYEYQYQAKIQTLGQGKYYSYFEIYHYPRYFYSCKKNFKLKFHNPG